MALFHCALRGTIHSATVGEQFSHSFGISSITSPETVAQAVADQWKIAWEQSTIGLAVHYSTGITYTEATAALVLDQVKPDLGAAYHAQFTPPLAGTNANRSLPSQNAVAISWTAGNRPNGTPFRGRMYMPNPVQGDTATDGLILPSTQNMVRDSIVNWIGALKLLGHTPVVWSRTVAGLYQPIQTVRVGNRVDTIRSRRNRFAESYVTGTVA